MTSEQIKIHVTNTCGKVISLTEIGEYTIVSYDELGTIYFKPFVKGRDTNHSFNNLDEALIFAIAFNAGHYRAAQYIINMLR